MSYKEVLSWGRRYHWPQLVLESGNILRHGKAHYQALRGDDHRLALAMRRIERWNKLVGTDQVVQKTA